MNQGERIWASTCADLGTGGRACEEPGYETDFGKWRRVKLGFIIDFFLFSFIGMRYVCS